MRLRREWWVVVACTMTAAYFVLVWVLNANPHGGAFDIYMHYYPNMVYAARQWSTGHGLLWNPLQNCGQPFFGNGATALLYPPSWFFLVLSPDAALMAVTITNLTVGGIGAYLLGRTVGARPAAALCGACAFVLGNATVDTTTWSPMVGSPYVWLPAALWCCELILQRPSLRLGIGLALPLTMALLTGFPQPVILAYQVIALRVAWELATRRPPQRAVMLTALAVGLVLPPLLAAIHFFPSLESASLSIRNRPLTMIDIVTGAGALSWERLRSAIDRRVQIDNPVILLPVILAAASLFSLATRRIAFFYGATALTYLILAFGPSTPFFGWYLALPINRTFRGPSRLLWVVGLCLPVMTALGVEAILRFRRTFPLRMRAPVVCALCAATILLWLVHPNGLRGAEWLLAAAVIAVALRGGGDRPWAVASLVAAVLVSLAAFSIAPAPPALRAWSLRAPPFRPFLDRSGQLAFAQPVFDGLRREITPQERVFIIGEHGNFRLMPKSASLFDFRSVLDYEPAPTRRLATYQVMMESRFLLDTLSSYYYRGPRVLPVPPLLNLSAGRYLLIPSAHAEARPAAARYRTRFKGRHVDLYENTDALPRAFFVPRVEITPDPDAVLQRLASGRDDPREVALVEESPPSGFLGLPLAGAASSVEFVTDDPERLVLRVNAPQRGFLHLADQYYPGWYATVNGDATPIVRANYLFRLIEVPAGESLVELRFAPLSVRVGAVVSLLSVLAVIALVRVTRPRPGAP